MRYATKTMPHQIRLNERLRGIKGLQIQLNVLAINAYYNTCRGR